MTRLLAIALVSLVSLMLAGCGSSDAQIGSSDGLVWSSDGLVGSSDGLVESSDGQVESSDGLVGSSDGRVLVGESTHGYALAYSPARRVFEGDDGSLHVFFYDGQYIVVSSMNDGETFGPPTQVSHVPLPASGFSVAGGDGFFLVAYMDPTANAVVSPTLHLRRVDRSRRLLTVREPSPGLQSDSSSAFQAPSVSLAPDGIPWIVFREDRGSGDGFPVFVVQAKTAEGTSWNDPVQVSNAEQVDDSSAGTSGAIYWPGTEPVIIHGGATALHASVHTRDGWQPYVVDSKYTGVHGFSGVVVGDTLHLAYIVVGELRLIRYTPNAGWSEPVPIGVASSHSVTMSTVNGVPTVFGYDAGQGIIWYRTLEMEDSAIIASIRPDAIQYAWTASPTEASGIIAVWVEGSEPPYKIYLKRLDPD